MAVKRLTERFIVFLVRLTRIDLQILALNELGVLRSGDYTLSGEQFFLEKILPMFIEDKKPIFFDVGANTGDYSKLLASIFPKATIYAFEPNPHTYKILQSESKNQNIITSMIGISSSTGEATISLDPKFLTSGSTSLYGEKIESLGMYDHDLSVKEKIRLSTLDLLTSKANVGIIDFLKIDIEGNELEALRGGVNLIKKDRIGIIQFEFNVTNIASRVFLKDFYDLLEGYRFYRIKQRGLVALNAYSPLNEVYRIQNILAISNRRFPIKSFDTKLKCQRLLFDRYGRHSNND